MRGILTLGRKNSISSNDPRQLVYFCWFPKVVSRRLINILQGFGVDNEDTILLMYPSAFCLGKLVGSNGYPECRFKPDYVAVFCLPLEVRLVSVMSESQVLEGMGGLLRLQAFGEILAYYLG